MRRRVSPSPEDIAMTKFALGQPVTRMEDAALVTGGGRYSDDVRIERAAHAFILRSPHAHARIRGLDVSRAQAAPGVVGVFSGRDVAADGLGAIPCLVPVTNRDGTKRADTPRPILALDRVRHVGDPVAAVVAETLALARDAAELIDVDYEPLEAVADLAAASRPGAPLAWDHVAGNVAFDIVAGTPAAEANAAFGKAARTVSVKLVNNRLVANPIEPRCAIADYDRASGRSTLYTPSQGTQSIREQVANAILKIGEEKLRVVSGNVGGAFGMKIFVHPEQPIAVWASRKLERAVRWTADRSEGFLSDVQGRDNVSIAELALDADGRFLALRVTTDANMGAYLSNFGPFIPQLAVFVLSGVYRIPAVHVHIRGILTNTVPVDAYRGAGRPEGIYLLERLIDLAARECGYAPDELRRRNFIAPEEMPYKTATGCVYDSGDFAALMADALRRADWQGFPQRREAAKRRGRLAGIGLAMYIERCGGGGSDTVSVAMDGEGNVTVTSGMVDNGQGHGTSFVQLVSERLGIDAARIRVVQGDSDLVPSGMTGGSRFLSMGGNAARGAADEVIRKGKETAGELLEAAVPDLEYTDGRYRVVGTDREVPLETVARHAGGLLATHTHASDAFTFPNGCHVCEVEIDPETGETAIVRYTVVDDLGRSINPLLLEGQIHGGTVQGIGQALLEHAVYDAESAQLLTGSFLDYAMPRADDVPMFDCAFRHVPCTTNPLGVKGAGEAGAVGAPPAVINAVVDALAPVTGITHIDMPATRDRVWRVLQDAATKAA
jgi:carbon-monoxide dehydrogenase large subunit